MRKIILLLLCSLSIHSIFCMESQQKKNQCFSINLKIKKNKLASAVAKKRKRLPINQKIRSVKLELAALQLKNQENLELYRKACQHAETLNLKKSKDIKVRWIKHYESRMEELEWLKANPEQATIWDNLNPINPSLIPILCKWRKELAIGS